MKMRKFCRCGHTMREHVKPGLSPFIHSGSGPCIRCDCQTFHGQRRHVPGVTKYSQGTVPEDYAPSPEPEPLRW